MAKESKILAIDIGGENLKMAEFYFPGDGSGIQLTGFLFRKMERNGEESNAAVFERNYLEMLREGGFTAKEVRLSLSAQNSFQRLSKLPPILGSRAAINRLIEFEAAQAVPYSMDEVEWDYQLLHHKWNEMVEVEQEDGTKVETPVPREEYEALFVAMKSEDVVCYTDIIEDSGKKLLSVEVAPIALFNAAVASQVKENECTMLINIGGTTTSLMISENRRVFMRNIPIGGETVTSQIVREFGVTRDVAEDYKRRYGFVALGGAYEDPESEFSATISKLARNVMTRLHGEISRSISVWRAQHDGGNPVRVLLCGGGSTMMYTTDFFQEKLRIPTEYLNTFPLISVAPGVDRNQLQVYAPMFQPLIGLALHSAGRCPIDVSLLPRTIKKQMLLDSRKPYFYASAVALICCLLVFIFGIDKQLKYESGRVTKNAGQVKKVEEEAKRINNLNNELNSAKSQYEEAAQILLDRKKWSVMINELQKKIPDNMWLISLDYDGEKKLQTKENQTDDLYSDLGMDMPEVKTNEQNTIGKKQDIKTISNLQEIKKIQLTGYTLDDPYERAGALNHFMAAIRQSELFEEVKMKNTSQDNVYNLTYFEIDLTLKEPLKK